MKIRILSYDAVFGFVDYGETPEIDSDKSYIPYFTKERCKNCGAAWLAENYVSGRWQCPKCGTTSKAHIMHIKD